MSLAVIKELASPNAKSPDPKNWVEALLNLECRPC